MYSHGELPNPPGVFDGESPLLCNLADAKIEEGIDAIRRFFAEQRCLPTEESCTAAQMVPSERTIRRRFGSFGLAAAAAGISVQTTYDGQKRHHARRESDWSERQPSRGLGE